MYKCAIPISQVIEKMERALDSKLTQKDIQSEDKRPVVKKQKGGRPRWGVWTLCIHKHRQWDSGTSCLCSCFVGGTESRKDEIESALAAENARLREDLQKIRQQPAPIIIQQFPQVAL